MALSLDLLNLICTVPQADMLDVTGTSPTEIRELNLDTFRTEWGALMDNEENVSAPWPFEWTQPVTLGPVTYAPLLRVVNGWTVIFSDGAYNVNITGGNSNMSDVLIKNTVGVNTANSAGLQDSESLQAASFDGCITVDPTVGVPGTTFPIGTAQVPVSNLADAHLIGHERGIFKLKLKESMTIAENFSEGWTFEGDNISTVATISASADLSNSTFRELQVTGDTGGGSLSLRFERCLILTLTSHGQFDYCGFAGTLTLNAAATNFTALVNCFSLVAGGGPSQTPTLDFDGGDHDVVVRGWMGGLTVLNQTSALNDISMDFIAGQLVLGPTNTSGTLTVRGITTVRDTSSMTVVDETTTTDAAVVRRFLMNKTVTDPVGGTFTVYDEDDITVLFQAPLWENVAETQQYQGSGAEVRGRLT